MLQCAAGAVFTLAMFSASSVLAQLTPDDGTSMGGGDCAKNTYNCADTPNPLPAADTVWLEKMTWMDVRDAMKAGKKTIIISTGGIEPNGPWVTLGKHNWVLETNCESIARALGDALCAPVVPFVPEGSIEPRRGHMLTMGTISLEQATFEALLTDIVRSFKANGFERIFMIGDSGGNIKGMAAVAAKLSDEKALVAAIPEYYHYDAIEQMLRDKGILKPGMKDDGLHDSVGITLNIMANHPEEIRWEERVAAGKASLAGVSFEDKEASLKLAHEIIAFRTKVTVDAIKKVIAEKGQKK